MSRANVAAIDRIIHQLDRLVEPDASDLMEEWEDIVTEDNRRGVLAGTDGFGRPMTPVTCRPKDGKPKRVTARQRNNFRPGHQRFSGRGPAASGFNNNLTSAEYRRLGGPALAARGEHARVITNLQTEHHYDRGRKVWEVVAGWVEVVSVKGVEFLIAHFTGARVGRGHKVKLPVRDLRGIRPGGQQEMGAAVERWGHDYIQVTFR